MTTHSTVSTDAFLDAALMHVPFDGWSETTLRATAADLDLTQADLRAMFPRGAVDLALAFHKRGDAAMVAAMAAEDLGALRYSERVARAVRLRLEAVEDKEAVRRGAALFSIPLYAADGAQALWGTADAIWTALGDTSQDANWYTKRATLSGVYASTVLYWLGDDSLGHEETWRFLDRRIDGVMRFEKFKSSVRNNPALGPLARAAERAMSGIRPPKSARPEDLPGKWTPATDAAP